MSFNIEFQEHVGKKKTVLGEVEVKLDQQQIFATNDEQPEVGKVLCGYVGNKSGSPINLVVNLGSDANKVLTDAIQAKLDESGLHTEDAVQATHAPVSKEEEEAAGITEETEEEAEE